MENKNKRKFSARGVVTFFAFWLLVGSFFFIFQTCTQALDPTPPLGSEQIYYSGVPSAEERAYSIRLVDVMDKYGNFNNLVPILIYNNIDSVYLILSTSNADGSPQVVPVESARQVSVTPGDDESVFLYQLVENGFGYRTRLYSWEQALETIIGYYTTSAGKIEFNNEYYQGTPITNYTLRSYYTIWENWEFSAVSGGGSGDGDQIIVNELDIGSIIASLPQAARNILDSAFGFELFGINIAATLTAVLLVAIVAFVIKWLMSR